MTLLVYVLVIALLVWLGLYLVGLIPVPNPPGPIPVLKIVLQVVVVVIAIWLLLRLIGLIPGPPFPRLG